MSEVAEDTEGETAEDTGGVEAGVTMAMKEEGGEEGKEEAVSGTNLGKTDSATTEGTKGRTGGERKGETTEAEKMKESPHPLENQMCEKKSRMVPLRLSWWNHPDLKWRGCRCLAPRQRCHARKGRTVTVRIRKKKT